MSRKRQPDQKLVEKWISAGHGQGAGGQYIPFFKVRDVPSLGRSHRVISLLNHRIQEFLSDTEYAPNPLAEFSTNTLDIREQFPLLPWEETLEIADNLKIRHPKYPGTKTPIVMTTDLVLTLKAPAAPFAMDIQTRLDWSKSRMSNIYLPICVKPDSHLVLPDDFDASDIAPLNKPYKRIFEKILIERTYWERRNLALAIISPSKIPWIAAWNLDRHRHSIYEQSLCHLDQHLPVYSELFIREWRTDRSLNDLFKIASRKLQLSIDSSAHLFGRALWLKKIPIDLNESIRPQFPIKLYDHESGGMNADSGNWSNLQKH